MEDPDTCPSAPFESFCIVCDRAIVPPKPVDVVKAKKKPAAGTIRVKNPNGTVTTYNADGTKTTRPTLRRGPSSQNRLVVAATNNTAVAKLAPLTRSHTADPTPVSAPAPVDAPTAPSPPAPLEWCSSIYCSKACALVEETRSLDLSRRMSYEPKLEVITTVVGSPYGPPSPLYMGSDTSSDPDAAPAAYSAPNAPFFAITREGPDAAWRDIERQRRSSIHPVARPTSMAMARLPSSHSVISGDPSSDSLNSLWQDELARSSSGRGELRMTPAHAQALRRGSSSSGSERVHVRSSLSQVSIASSPEKDLPPEFGSAPNHTYNLWTSYHSAFPVRDSTGTSSGSHRGFVFPGHPTAMRRNSSSRGPTRVKSKGDVTWDSFGRDEILSRARTGSKSDVTPKQSVEGDLRVGLSRGETIKAMRTARANSIEEEHPNALAIPSRRQVTLAMPTPTLQASATPASHTPTSKPLLSHRATTGTGMPDLASLRVGPTCAPYLSSETARPSSAPKPTFNWDEFEKKGGKVYEVPKALKVNTTKAGLFFFK